MIKPPDVEIIADPDPQNFANCVQIKLAEGFQIAGFSSVLKDGVGLIFSALFVRASVTIQ